jgi:long-chain acyl-CoA synthetase
MLGYWRDESLTAEAMTADGWFRTKDLVRIDEDGYVYVVGRLSDLIIRGGINISPGEVERVIRQHDDVADVAVVGVPDDIYGERVLAAVVPRDTVDLDDLKAAVAANLTAYKVPSEYVVVESIPVNSTTGKVDRRSLVTVLLAGTSQEERA